MHDRPIQELNSGSRWHRWGPDVHVPGTILNHQFKGPDGWEPYLTALETKTPAIRAIGVTDCYTTHTYERVVARALVLEHNVEAFYRQTLKRRTAGPLPTT